MGFCAYGLYSIVQACRLHFAYKKAAILKQMEVWSRRDPSLQGLAAEIQKALEPYDLKELQGK